MNRMSRPAESAPGGMGGATRMHDPSEALHDRVRGRCMNIAFVLIVALLILQIKLIGLHGIDWLRAILLTVAAAPLAMAVRIFELRFKMATGERRRMLGELPRRIKLGFLAYALLAVPVFALNTLRFPWALLGIWFYDFVTYYHDRPERIRHLYAVAKTFDDLRAFRAPWAWTLPALILEAIRLLFGR